MATDPNTPATSPTPPAVAPPAKPSWLRRYWIPVGVGTAAAWFLSAPLLAGAALGAGGRYVYEKFKATS